MRVLRGIIAAGFWILAVPFTIPSMALLAVAKVLAGRTDTPEEPLEELDPALFDANDWNGLGLLGMALMEREYASRRMEFAPVDVIAVYPDFKKRTIRIDMRRMLPEKSARIWCERIIRQTFASIHGCSRSWRRSRWNKHFFGSRRCRRNRSWERWSSRERVPSPSPR